MNRNTAIEKVMILTQLDRNTFYPQVQLTWTGGQLDGARVKSGNEALLYSRSHVKLSTVSSINFLYIIFEIDILY